ncbi:MAG: FIST C-terminal domain-containing protein [Bacteroidetes bacterium]|nr:FIST C-terminal domain-containing protein [Bacteroidota bacterium]
MQIEQKKWTPENTWETLRSDLRDSKEYQLVLVFGSRTLLSSIGFYDEIRNCYPKAQILMNSTSGEIIDTQVNDDTISLTAIRFDNTPFKTISVNIQDYSNAETAGNFIAQTLFHSNITNVLIFADGHQVDGNKLVLGLENSLTESVIISGGFASDGNKFQKTLLGLNEQPCEGKIIAVGFYGKHLTVSHGRMDGWEEFGKEIQITKSNKNTIIELNHEPALKIYNQYLNKHLPSTEGQSLLFPVSIKSNETQPSVFRKIKTINEDEKSITFDGAVPVGSYIRMMKANFESLINGASAVAKSSAKNLAKPDLAIVISNVGRKFILSKRIEEEVEVIREVLGESTAITGFYSYGDISFTKKDSQSGFNNQSMTITTMRETK